MTTGPILGTVLILALAATIQSAVGFAAAMFAMPLLLWIGNDLMVSQVLIFTAMMPQNVLGVWKLRKHVDPVEIVAPASIRILAMPIGIFALTYVLTWSKAGINQLVACIILVAVASQALVGIEWKSAKRWYWMLVTFGGSGFMQGMSGMSGPPLVLWVHGQRYPPKRARAFLFSMYISNFTPQVLLLWWQFGSDVGLAMGTALISLPLVLIGAMLGHRIGNRLGERLRPLSYALLLCMAVYCLVGPWLKTLLE